VDFMNTRTRIGQVCVATRFDGDNIGIYMYLFKLGKVVVVVE
jgi:hypothetical protein